MIICTSTHFRTTRATPPGPTLLSRGERVVGFYTLAAASVSREEVPSRVAKGMARHPVPVILLARLAVDRTEQGKGLGAGLLKDALLRAVQAADVIGCRAILVHAKDESRQAVLRTLRFRVVADQ